MDTVEQPGKISARANRSHAFERFELELDGVSVGFVHSSEGGAITAEVVQERLGTNYFVGKHLGSIRYEEVTITADLALDSFFYTWIADTWSGKFTRRDVTIYRVDPNQKILGVSEYYNSLITEVTIPAMDASSKESAYLSIKFAPEYTRHKKGSGGKLKGSPLKKSQKKWLPSNFKVTISGVESSKVTKVEAFTVKQALKNVVGELRDYLKEPTSVEFPNLSIHLPEASAQSWVSWHEDFVVKGNNGAAQEKTGSLVFMSPDLKEALAQINFSGIGIFKLASPENSAGADQIRRVKAELYVEQMAFVYGEP